MGVSTKGCRKLTLDGRQFVWYVCEDDDSSDFVLHVASQDKRFIVHYHLGKSEEERVVTVVGKEFGGVPDTGHCHAHILCPKFEQDGVIGPGAVRRLIVWSLSRHEGRVRRLWTGELMALPFEVEKPTA